MAQHWQEMLPIDRYAVSARGLLHEYDRKVLTFLYQPLIGSTCFSLYMTLWSELEENRLWSNSNTHHSLMNFMDLGLSEIYKARIKLEGIGLLKVYEKKDNSSRSFIYELIPPLTPEQFFLDGMLNIYLYRKIGKNQYARLKRFFSEDSLQSKDDYSEVTKSFQDVYMTTYIDSISYDVETEQAMKAANGNSFIGREENDPIQISHDIFNFELLEAGLNESLIPKKALTNKVRNAISNLAFLYGLDAIQMKNIVISAITEDDEINIEELRKSARDWYQFQHNDQLPSLVDRIQPVAHRIQKKEALSREEELLNALEITSPRQVLKDISGGAEPSKADLQIIEDVMFHQKLLPGVVNVLIQYVMLKSDMKLTKGYVEKIASHWARKKIKTAKEAIDLAKNEHKQYMEWAEGKKKRTKSAGNKKVIRTEMLPDWFEEIDNPAPERKNKYNEEELELKEKELNEILKRLQTGKEGK
ncbi:replication initiation and membrane attachment family protein [Bacillus sp. FJAT-49705]|uniref:Replication initiation and membrane attachment family protein n=1 Tax=Cytobacillus citreus TaxID=2833586 RepID=A0ABS5NUR3_9BACI|nr:replication initiation and membrane attachment family protein [Cytobacillus citreus]MBS4191563.1 replication initiation and membrane attachment family protein [Cytobacillus citreus]